MADNHIEINTNTRLGYEARDVVDTLARTRARLRQLKSTMEQQTDGVSYAQIEARVGIAAGKGDEFYNLVVGALAELDADFVVGQLLDWCEAKV